MSLNAAAGATCVVASLEFISSSSSPKSMSMSMSIVVPDPKQQAPLTTGCNPCQYLTIMVHQLKNKTKWKFILSFHQCKF